MKLLLFVALCLLVVGCQSTNTKLIERFSWKSVDFEFSDEKSRAEAIKNGDYVPENNLPLGVEAWKNKLFITCPRWKGGIPASLTYVNIDDSNKSPKLKPYPNWNAHKLQDKSGGPKIANVFRLHVDVCDRLWLLDTGMVDILGKREVIYQPKIQAFDLNTNKLVVDYTIPAEHTQSPTFFANIISDVNKDNCAKAYAYVADLLSNALIVYNLEKGTSHRVTHHYFHFDPLLGNYNIAGHNFQWNDGIFGLALSPIQSDGYRTLYFHPMSSTREFAVSTKVIQDKTASEDYHSYRVLGSRGPTTQSSGSSLDEKSGVLFYTLLNKDAVGCWNTKSEEYNADTNAVVASDGETMVFPNDLKVDKNSTLWVLTDKLPKLLFGKLNFEEVNYRIFSAPVEDVIKDTVCDIKSV